MKIIKLLLTAILLSGTALVTLAQPPSQRTSPSSAMRTTEEFARLDTGDKVAYVCKQCDSITVATIESQEHAMQLCKEGEKVTCPACNKVARVVRHGRPGKGATRTEVRYVNEKGEDCMFIAKLDQ